ncbi:Beta-ketoacyl synthase, N-terminal domain [Ferrimonas sediminum]|uniref:Beta-ketoacyl synthase, N-terminal domain n=2 Tax=Ferrimonas sediminum TaxID=718193 RepID=A0A1G8N9V1_9GAMM|nr:Beta-ketoacyl synthase, N-terminal domain [Ferrimonas sediminum]
MKRRRLTRLAKMALHVAEPLNGEGQLATVFASQHGEVGQTVDMLDRLLAGEAVSPTRFSQSVHNFASGSYGIHFSNTQASTSIAAGSDTLLMALIEGQSQLSADQDVLVVYMDEPVPARFLTPAEPQQPAMALALRLSLSASTRLLARACEAPADHPPLTSVPWQVLRMLNSAAGGVVMQQERQRYHWSVSR